MIDTATVHAVGRGLLLSQAVAKAEVSAISRKDESEITAFERKQAG